MKKELFEELLESVRQSGAILPGERKPSRVFEFSEPDVRAVCEHYGLRKTGQVTTLALVPRVVDAVRPTPVVAAGGIGDARGVVAALAFGAEGVVLGTRFLLLSDGETVHNAFFDRRFIP